MGNVLYNCILSFSRKKEHFSSDIKLYTLKDDPLEFLAMVVNGVYPASGEILVNRFLFHTLKVNQNTQGISCNSSHDISEEITCES